MQHSDQLIAGQLRKVEGRIPVRALLFGGVGEAYASLAIGTKAARRAPPAVIMHLSITIDGQPHTLEVERDLVLSWRLDGVAFPADAVELKPGVFSVIIAGNSFHVRVAAINGSGDAEEFMVESGGECYSVVIHDPRRKARARRAKPAPEGRQNVASLMPGKVVRLLVSEGQDVASGQGLVIVEAMKMQNEIKCLKPGKVQKVMVREGQAVNAGEVLLVVE